MDGSRPRCVGTILLASALLGIVAPGCQANGDPFGPALDPDETESAPVDRFSDLAGLFRRSEDPTLPAQNEPIDFDARFAVRGLGPAGERVTYYTFDGDNGKPMAVYRIVTDDGEPILGQLDVVASVPGEPGYSDFWQIFEVAAPADYVANSITSEGEVEQSGLEVQATEVTLNRPIAPRGSTAMLRFVEDTPAVSRAWFDDKIVEALAFDEHPLRADRGAVAYATVYVCIGAAEDGSTTPAGFCAEDDGEMTRNVVDTLPGDDGYSPYWLVRSYAPTEFSSVDGLSAAMNATGLESRGLVNCPVVAVE